jgi:hypothetical protein
MLWGMVAQAAILATQEAQMEDLDPGLSETLSQK